MLIFQGYATFFPTNKDYDLKGAPASWAKVPAARHALSKFPYSAYVWYLDQNSLIMNPEIKVETHIMDNKKLESLMIKDQPIVPPDSVIKTWPHLKGENVDLVLTQDKDGLAQGSFIVKRGDWGKFFLDTWFDPLYRSYNFQKADTHALVSYSISQRYASHSNYIPGTHCPVAPNYSIKNGHRSATHHKCIRTRPLYRNRWKI
jgi:mannan polymerase II complex MNN11 subunit